MVQDQYRQGNRKNYENESQLKQDTLSKQLYSDPSEICKTSYGWKSNFPNDIWDMNCEEDLIISGNETEEDDNFFLDTNDYPDELFDLKRNRNWKKSKNVRFEGTDFKYVIDSSETSSLENEPSDNNYEYEEHRRSFTQEPAKVQEHLRMGRKLKYRTIDRYEKQYERRPKSTPEKIPNYLDVGPDRRSLNIGEYAEICDHKHRMKKLEQKYGRPHGDIDHPCGEMINRKQMHNFEYEDNFRRQRHGDFCEYRPPDEGRKKSYMKSSSLHKHICHVKDSIDETIPKTYKKLYKEGRQHHERQFDSFAYNTANNYYYQPDEYYEHGKSKKKVLEAVEEQQEQLSDSTYKVLGSKFSSQTVPEEMAGFVDNRPLEKMANVSQSDWLYWKKKNLGDKMTQPQRLHKLRSRRTRMNRLKNGWKKAFVQTVRDGSRNEQVGVIVMGPEGPEFYSKNQTTQSKIEISEKKYMEPSTRSFDAMPIDCKNVFLSSPESKAPFASTTLASPENDVTVDEKLINFSKNVNEIVRCSEEKFYKALSDKYQKKNKSSEDKKMVELDPKDDEKEKIETDEATAAAAAAAAAAEEEKTLNPTFFLPHQTLSPRIPKALINRERKINDESKTVADALNNKAKEYKENMANMTEKEAYLDSFKHLREKYPPKQLSEETAKANLSVWGIQVDSLINEKAFLEGEQESEIPLDCEPFNNEKRERKTDMGDTLGNNKMKYASNDELNRKTSKPSSPTRKKLENHYESDSATISQMKSENSSKRMTLTTNWVNPAEEENARNIEEGNKECDRNTISEMFRDLVENGRAISKEESENLQNLFSRVANQEKNCNNDVISEISNEGMNMLNESKENPSPPSTIDENSKAQDKQSDHNKYYKEEKENKKLQKKSSNNGDYEDSENVLDEISLRKVLKLKTQAEQKLFKKLQNKIKSKKKTGLEDKMKILREALPSFAAENEAAHLKQLKKYIDRFIERVETSTSNECKRKKQSCFKSKDSVSTNSSEVKVDARRILDIVNNPFRTISSDVTINIAKKLTDALIQEKTSKRLKTPSAKTRKNSEPETEEEKFSQCGPESGSDRYEETEPAYLKQLRKMRNEHLNNIVVEVKRLSDLLRFLDRCNRLTF